jgi:hypothetical protein
MLRRQPGLEADREGPCAERTGEQPYGFVDRVEEPQFGRGSHEHGVGQVIRNGARPRGDIERL